MERGGGGEDGVVGEFLDRGEERFYRIRRVDRMEPFFISVVSGSDHWLFVSSTGGLTAGRVSPQSALFPYVPVDKIYDTAAHTGSKTVLRLRHAGGIEEWQPLAPEHDGRFRIERHLYKNVLGDKLCFEEVNHDLGLVFRYTWATSERFGFIRTSELENISGRAVVADVIDGLQNILPAGTPRALQATASNLVDAYKWTELDEDSGLALFTLYSGITDRPQPYESLRANTVFCLGLGNYKVFLSAAQLRRFREGHPLEYQRRTRGIRGAFLVNTTLELEPGARSRWQLVADVEKTQAQVVALRRMLMRAVDPGREIDDSVAAGSDRLRRLMAGADGFQMAAEENVTAHHYANVLYNSMRGGVFEDQYSISAADFTATIRHFNRDVYERNRPFLEGLREGITSWDLAAQVERQADPRLTSLCLEYLPVSFGRRHGDPSRPWNEFSIRLKDENGNRLLSYEGNWRDIFQNWEALSFSFPEFIEGFIAKFVNASTPDGYNPYRITKAGIDWEAEDPDDPWSYIGYWGDHQIIYLLKLLESSRNFHPQRLAGLLRHPIFCYANVPYRLKSFEHLQRDPKNTVEYSHQLAEKIDHRVRRFGADGKLLMNDEGEVCLVNLLEKLLVPLLGKVGNLVVDGGIWMNTQRPEWNDANNALVGHGLSMVTLYYLRRYVVFLQGLLESETGSATVSAEIDLWLRETSLVLDEACGLLTAGKVSKGDRARILQGLGEAASRYREAIYAQEGFSGVVPVELGTVQQFLQNALQVIDHSIASNRRPDRLYESYNLLRQRTDGMEVRRLYLMLEGQVAVISSGALGAREVTGLLESLFASELYRPDQESFMLYPDRSLPGFLQKNIVSETEIEGVPVLRNMTVDGEDGILVRDEEGHYRFNADLINGDELDARIDELVPVYGEALERSRDHLQGLYEMVFNHRSFTGRSGGMFGFEGLGCIYWHMVSKLLLTIQETFFSAMDDPEEEGARLALGQLYYRVRNGIGFQKTPVEYGAFPTDPYSHTPKHSGASQPGMTGQVKEEILTRFGELGIRVSGGRVAFQPRLLRPREFLTEEKAFDYVDVSGQWRQIRVPAGGLAFTWCQLPIIYLLEEGAARGLTVHWKDGSITSQPNLELAEDAGREVFLRTGRIQQLTIRVNKEDLLEGETENG